MTDTTSACPTCGNAAGVEQLESVQHLMYYPPHFDADGKRHLHDSNRVTTVYWCAKCDAWWEVNSYKSCWCGWTGGPPPVVVPKERATFDDKLLRRALERARQKREKPTTP